MDSKAKDKFSILFGVLFLTLMVAFISVFKRDDGVISEKGKKILSNKKNNENLLEAFRKGEKSAEITTEQGEVIHIG